MTFTIGTMPKKATRAKGHVEDYECRVPSLMSMLILVGGKCIGSGNGSHDIEASPGDAFGQDGPIIPKRLVGDVDALSYIKFASLRNDSPRFHPAGPLQVYSKPLDTFKQRPPWDITRGRFSFPLKHAGMISVYACLQCIAGHMLGTDKCLELVLYRKSPWGEELPVMLWSHGRWTVFSDARGTLKQLDGSSLACAHVFTSVVAQYCLGVLRFLILERYAEKTPNRYSGHIGFEDQHALMRWLQDSAAGLDLNKTSAILFGHGVGGWLPCHHLLQGPRKVVLEVPLFAAVIMHSGFCDDVKAV